jgi:peptidoglycan/LPS O-acetylase OafA/YrhL
MTTTLPETGAARTSIIPHASPDALMGGKLDVIELVRFIAACGVVWFHVPGVPYREYGHAGLVCFILIAIVFQAAGAGREPAGRYFKKRASRILTPWLFWFAFYGLFNLAKGKPLFPHSEGFVAHLLTGPWVGLWFMPFILLASVPVFLLAKLVPKTHAAIPAGAFLAVGLAQFVIIARAQDAMAMVEPWAQWLQAASAIPIGLAIRFALRLRDRQREIGMLAIATAMAALCAAQLGTNHGMAVTYGIATPAVCGGFLCPQGHLPWASRLGALCLGVYMVHAAVISVFRQVPFFAQRPAVLCAAVLAISFAGVFLARKNRLLAKVL